MRASAIHGDRIGSLVHPVRVVSGMTGGCSDAGAWGRERVCARLRQAVRMAG